MRSAYRRTGTEFDPYNSDALQDMMPMFGTDDAFCSGIHGRSRKGPKLPASFSRKIGEFYQRALSRQKM